MKKEYSKNELRLKAEAYCSSSEHCKSEVEAKLRLWGGEEHLFEIMHGLIEGKFIDETRFCRAFVRDKYRFNHWGKTKIVQALRYKKLSDDDIESGIKEIEDDEYDNNLLALILKKRKNVKGKDERDCNIKIIKYALSKGYEMKSILKYINSEDLDERISD